MSDIKPEIVEKATEMLEGIVEPDGVVFTHSHLAWVHRMLCKNLQKEAELAALQEKLDRQVQKRERQPR